MNNLFTGVNLNELKMEDIDGEKHVEREYTAYALVPDFLWTDAAVEHETHEQWQIEYAEGIPIRGRLRLINNRRYTEAVKEPLVTEDGSYECEFDISRDAFEMKKKACKNGYIKERFNFPIEGTPYKWEIDVFKSKAGGRHSWVKIDLEYGSRMDALPEFPFEVKELILIDRDSSTEAREMVNDLWENEWLKIEHNQAHGKRVD